MNGGIVRRSFDETAIRNHFWMLHHLAERAGIPGKLVLSGIADKTTGLPILNQHFTIGDVEGMVAAAMGLESKPYGLYAPYCIMRHDLAPDSKGSQDDVVATLAYPVDADSDHPGQAVPHAPVSPNYVIESSAGNLQEIIVLHQPLAPTESKPLARALKEKTGDKNCVGDIARVMRVPGTLNWPSAAKINRGRSPEPQIVRVVQSWDSWTTIDDLREAVAFVAAPPLAPSDMSPALAGYRIEEVSWWINRKKENGDLDWSQQDWAMFGGALKLHFGDDGLELFQRISGDPDQAEQRFEKFPYEYREGNRTLHWYLDRHEVQDLDWMWRHLSGCPKPPPGPKYELPQEILDRLNAGYLATQIGPLPDHPELTAPQADAISRFWAHLPSGKILEETSRTFYIAGSVDKHVGRIKDYMKTGPGVQASTWLSQHRYVDSVGWDPDKPMIVEDRIFVDEWIPASGKRTFNLYLPSAIVPVEGDASTWLNHIKTLYPNEAEHILRWCAHRVQRPGEKVNHGLVFIGEPGIGKDIAIEPVIASVGAQNFKSISAKDFFKSDFNAYLESVLLRIDEVHDLGGESKYAFHDRLKTVMAAPPASHYINAKHVPHHSARNVCGVILTSNHTDAVYIDPLDRRHFVCISERKKADFPEGYFDEFGEWLASGGNEAVAYLLANLDISAFRAKGEPPKTAGWHRIVAAGMAPESGELGDVIDALGKPAALTLWDIRMKTDASGQLSMMLNDPKQSRNLPRRLAECGYVKVLKPDAKDGRWRTESQKGKKTDIYARQDLNEVARVEAARARASWMPSPPPL